MFGIILLPLDERINGIKVQPYTFNLLDIQNSKKKNVIIALSKLTSNNISRNKIQINNYLIKE
jgi:hypothetical protein